MQSTSFAYAVVKETWLSRKPDRNAAFASLLTTMFLCLISLIYLLDVGGLAHLIDASGESVFQNKQFWRAWTTVFAHGDFGHLASNTFLFFILGFFLNGYFGLRVFPLAAFFWGGLTNLCVLATYDSRTTLVGASGIVYWMGGAWLAFYFFLSRQKNLTQRCLRTLGVAILIFMPAETFEPRISYRTHLIGFIFGILFGIWHFYRNQAVFRSAEVREEIVEDLDPLDELPPADGFSKSFSDKL